MSEARGRDVPVMGQRTPHPGVARMCGGCIVFALLLAAPALSEKTKIRGLVVDSAGDPIPGVTVVVSGDADAFGGRETTNRRGRFVVNLDRGHEEYRVRLEKRGFREATERLLLRDEPEVKVVYTLMSESEAAAEDAVSEDGDRLRESASLYNEGAKAYNDGDADRALDLLSRSVELDPELAIAHAALTRIHLERREWTRAVSSAERLCELESGKGPLLLLYDALWGAGNLERSAEVRDRLAAEYPGPEIALRVFNEGVDLWRSGDARGARQLLTMTLALDPSVLEAHLGLAPVLEATGELDEALGHLETYLTARPDDLRALEMRLRILESLGLSEKAEQARVQLQGVDPQRGLRANFEEGVRHFHAGRIDHAVESFEKALEIDPAHARSHYQLGLCFVSLGRTADARRELERFLELAPEASDADSVRRMLDLLD
jgi:Tfp pilus assembly protein PilF